MREESPNIVGLRSLSVASRDVLGSGTLICGLD